MRNYLSICIVLSLATMPLLTACQQQTQGEIARSGANDRFNLIQAQMSYDQARQAYETGQFDKAMREINIAIARYSEVSDYHLLKGRILLETNRLEASLGSFDKAIEIGQDNAVAHYFRGIVMQRWSEFEEARNSYLAAFDFDHNSVQYIVAAAEMDIALGNYADARHLIEPQMTYFEHNTALYELLGQISLLEGDYRTAAEQFESAHLLDPDDLMLLEDLAQAQFSSQQYESAYQTIKRLQQNLDMERPDLDLMEARCLAMTNRINEARSLFLALSQETPANPDVWIELGNVAYEVGDYRRVAIASSRAIALAPERFEGHLLKGLFEQHEGNTDAAMHNFQEAAERAPDQAWPYLLLGMIHEQKGETDNALTAYAAALRADPTNARAKTLFENVGRAVAGETDTYSP